MTNCQLSTDIINKIKDWVDGEAPLSDIFTMKRFSISGECYFLTEDAIIKTSRGSMMEFLQKKLNSHPVLEKYIIPTFIYTLPNRHNLDERHKNNLIEQKRNVPHYSDCLILQQKCEVFLKEESMKYYDWYKAQPDIGHLLDEYKIDLTYHNAGYLNGEIRYFDW